MSFPDDSSIPGFQCNSNKEILVTMNFTALSVYEMPRPSTTIVLLLSFADQTKIGVEILSRRAAPFVVIPGINVVAAVSQEVRQVFSKPSFAALGLFQVKHDFNFFCGTRTNRLWILLEFKNILGVTCNGHISRPIIKHFPVGKYFDNPLALRRCAFGNEGYNGLHRQFCN